MPDVSWNRFLLLLQQPDDRLRIALHVFLILILASGLAQLTWRLLPAPVLEAPQLQAVSSVRGVTNSANNDLAAQLPGWHLFGQVARKPRETSAPVPQELPQTKLRLTLRGVIASSDPAVARAIIADQAKRENFYRIGDRLPGNATLTEIFGDRITIKRGNNYETLILPKKSLELNASPSRKPVPRAGRAAAPAKYSLKNYRDTLLKDPQKLSDLIRLSQARKNGKFVGYTINPGRDPGFLSSYGLMPGDIVTEINGITLDSPTKGFRLMRDIQTLETLDLVVNRNGRSQRFTLPIK